MYCPRTLHVMREIAALPPFANKRLASAIGDEIGVLYEGLRTGTVHVDHAARAFATIRHVVEEPHAPACSVFHSIK